MIDAGKMRPAGMRLVEAARQSGEWEKAYRLADDHEVPEELHEALNGNATAWKNFQAVSNTDRHAFIALVEEARTDLDLDSRAGLGSLSTPPRLRHTASFCAI